MCPGVFHSLTKTSLVPARTAVESSFPISGLSITWSTQGNLAGLGRGPCTLPATPAALPAPSWPDVLQQLDPGSCRQLGEAQGELQPLCRAPGVGDTLRAERDRAFPPGQQQEGLMGWAQEGLLRRVTLPPAPPKCSSSSPPAAEFKPLLGSNSKPRLMGSEQQ